MIQYSNSTETTLVTFHTGRGGRFNNGGHTQYVDQDRRIDDPLYTENLFVHFEFAREVSEAIGERSNLRRLYEIAIDKGEGSIQAMNRLAKLGLDLGDEVYEDLNGTPVGLRYDNDGTGCINEDGQYDTTVVSRLEDCSDEQLQMIYESDRWVSSDVRAYCADKLGIECE